MKRTGVSFLSAGHFIWRNNKRVGSGYNGWMRGEPNGGRNARCGTLLINREKNAIGWNDVLCHQWGFAICEAGRVKQ